MKEIYTQITKSWNRRWYKKSKRLNVNYTDNLSILESFDQIWQEFSPMKDIV